MLKMPKRNRKFGNWGEKLAEEFLLKRNYEILTKNFHKQYGEIDIIAKKEERLHFVEVKTRTVQSIERFGLPEEAVNKIKQKKIIKTALAYLAENDCDRNIDWQIDVVSIIYYGDERRVKISFIKNAFDEN